MNHTYDVDCPCQDCLKITFAARFGQPGEHEIVGGGQQIGNVSQEHEVVGNPQSPNRFSGYAA